MLHNASFRPLLLLSIALLAAYAGMTLAVRPNREPRYEAIEGCILPPDIGMPSGAPAMQTFHDLADAERFICHRLPRVHEALGRTLFDIVAQRPFGTPPTGWEVILHYARGQTEPDFEHALNIMITPDPYFDLKKQTLHLVGDRQVVSATPSRPYSVGTARGHLIMPGGVPESLSWSVGGEIITAVLEIGPEPESGRFDILKALPLLRSIR